MVELMLLCVTSGLRTPGVRAGSAWYGPLDGDAEQDECKGHEQDTRRHRSRVRTELPHRKVSKPATAQPKPRLRSSCVDVRPKGCDRREGDHPRGDQAGR